MEWFDRYVGALESAFQQAPEVFEPIGVDRAIDVGFGMVNDVMDVSVLSSCGRKTGVHRCGVLRRP